MIHQWIAAYRGRRAYKKHGLNYDLNPYKPKSDTWFFVDCWTIWYEAHREMWYYDVIPDYDPKKYYDTTWGYA